MKRILAIILIFLAAVILYFILKQAKSSKHSNWQYQATRIRD